MIPLILSFENCLACKTKSNDLLPKMCTLKDISLPSSLFHSKINCQADNSTKRKSEYLTFEIDSN